MLDGIFGRASKEEQVQQSRGDESFVKEFESRENDNLRINSQHGR